MNVRVLNEKDSSVYQRVDWLVDKLATKVHSFFWLDEYPAKHDFARYWRDEWMDGLTSWRSSLEIPDSDVILEGPRAKVIDPQDRDKFYVVSNPGSEFSICDCTLSEGGNLCEHVCKVSFVCRKKESSKPSVSLYQYKRALIKMLCCMSHDSLIRDHAVSLMASLQTQLNALADFDSNERMINEIEQQAAFSMSSLIDNSLDIVEQGQVRNLSNGDARLLNNGVGEKGTSNESAFHDEMEIDPSSICISPSGLFAMHGVLPADILSVNEDKTLLTDFHDVNGNDTFHDGDISNQICPEDMTEESLSIDTAPSAESRDPCSVTNRYYDCGDKIAETVDSIDDNTALKFYRRSKSSTKAGPHPAKKQKTKDKEGEMKKGTDGKI